VLIINYQILILLIILKNLLKRKIIILMKKLLNLKAYVSNMRRMAKMC